MTRPVGTRESTGADRPVRGSVVIPAFDEAAVIGRCLDALFDGADDLDVVVACNGCSDDTAALARAYGRGVRVIDLPAPGKAGALRAADASTRAFPRIYLDADVVLPGAAAMAVLDALRPGGAVAARPPLRYDVSRSSVPVRAYYRARTRVPSVMTSLWGVGAYGLSESGRGRFDTYPDLVADDLFVAHCFDVDEVAVLDCPPAVVAVPRTTGQLLRILRRNQRGKAELGRTGGGVRQTTGTTLTGLVRASRSPREVVDAGVYAAFAVAARIWSRLPGGPRWERDDSSRGT